MNLNRTLQQLKDKYGRIVSRDFAAAIADITNSVVLRNVVSALDSGDINAALRALDIDEAVFARMRASITDAYAAGGTAVVASVKFSPPGQSRAVVRFDVSNPVAERYLREVVGRKITGIVSQTLDGARERMLIGYAQGHGPRQIALDVVGRVGASGRRTGGVLGLNGPQAQWVANMRQYLEAGDVKAAMRMSMRDKRFDRTLLKGGPFTKDQIDKYLGRYSDKLLKSRGDTIARTETASAVEQSRIDGFQVGMDKQGYPPQYAEKEWRHGGGGKDPREQHTSQSGTIVQGLNTPFIMPDGTMLQRPLDPDGPAKHTVNCTCSLLVRMNWGAMRRNGVI